MKKKVLIRCLIGAPIGVAISTMITIVISLTVGDGNFYAVFPELIADCGTEINAVSCFQIVCITVFMYPTCFPTVSIHSNHTACLFRTLIQIGVECLIGIYNCRFIYIDWSVLHNLFS